ncbi:hypothetical protein DFA_07979 [Cavenderia fasciculata]|uniref:Uncharacterized protein n=1 Tax=Cavenderia fasciculata TaxID=261658 RepID=F4Q4D6_CACFS|nr:uncharacterized protein DFA_07979 [Cavenderia fasciculata]EGG16998.1 hypothetical protein DFA_07979 [Cavenderia fasciculata]|eukprot:XP_004355482.1 hypothetical protein DFA_07979 [Cavenderia fasciculata]
MPQRTFSPRTFMGDRGIVLDSYGRVFDERILAPKAWKPTNNPNSSYSNRQFVDENLFEEAGQEIQTIILQSFNLLDEADESIILDRYNKSKKSSRNTATSTSASSTSSISTSASSFVSASVTTIANFVQQQQAATATTTTVVVDREDLIPLSTIIENYVQQDISLIPFFSTQSPGIPEEPITPPTRTHNPITLNQQFCSTDSFQQGAEIGLLSISP